MCGFAGKLARRGQIDPGARDLVARMAERLAHRGPDDSGFFADERLALGFRRLSIIDLASGHQPMQGSWCGDASTARGRPWIVFNGEIYNFVELRRELEAEGHRFATRSDTEVILHLYEARGDAFVERLRGMFAIALWDPARGALLLARDRLGKKPLYLLEHDGALYFASEIKSLLLVPGFTRRLDASSLDALLSLRFIPGNGSIFAGIRALPPAHLEVWNEETVARRRYWELAFEPKQGISEEQALAALEEKLAEAVRLRLRSDVPVGAFLSGGIDSGMVVALMREQGGLPETYSVGVAEESWNELPLAAATARRLGTSHHDVMVGADSARNLPHLLFHLDEPFADRYALALWSVAERAARDVKVVLTGDGGDEVFAGYDRYAGHHLLGLYRWLPAPVRRRLVSALLARLPLERSPALRALAWANELSLLPPAQAYTQGLAHFRFQAEAKEELYGPELRTALGAADTLAPVAAAFEEANAATVIDRMVATDSALRLPNYTLSRVDRITMAFGLEARAPILDHELMELAAHLPATLKIRGRRRKRLLRALAARRLPREVLEARKRGFGLPVGEWMRGAMASAVRDLCVGGRMVREGLFRGETVERLIAEHQSGSRDHTERVWMILNVELWHRLAMAGENAEELGERLSG